MSVKEEIRARKPFFTCSRHVKQLHETTGNSTGQKYLNLFFLHSSRQHCLLKDVRTSAVPVRTSRIPWSQPSKVFFRDKREDGAFPSRRGCLRPPLGTPLRHSDHPLACDCTPWALHSLREQPGLSLTLSPPVLTTFMSAWREHGTETVQLGNIWLRAPVDHDGQAGQNGPVCGAEHGELRCQLVTWWQPRKEGGQASDQSQVVQSPKACP